MSQSRHEVSLQEMAARPTAPFAPSAPVICSELPAHWEVYGDWHEDPAELETTVRYLIRSA